MALFSQWNEARFPESVMLVRAEVMRAAHIGSANTYLKCMRELTTYGLNTYLPSRSELRWSRKAGQKKDVYFFCDDSQKERNVAR